MSSQKPYANGGALPLQPADAITRASVQNHASIRDTGSAPYVLPTSMDLSAIISRLDPCYAGCRMGRLVNGATECTVCGRRGL